METLRGDYRVKEEALRHAEEESVRLKEDEEDQTEAENELKEEMREMLAELAEAERLLCTGPHRNCRLHFTRGTPPDRPPSPAAAWDAEHFRQQRAKNRAY